MRVSVVLCTYSLDAYEHFSEAAESVLAQTYDDVELVVVVDGNDDLHERVREDYGNHESVVVHCNDENRGLSYSRNRGVELASGDVVAFMDDDAVADERWIEELVETYERHDALAAGGRMTPAWVAGEPDFLPPEFYWLIGVTYRGFPEEETEVRNTFSSNLSFRREVFRELGGFRPHMGKQGTNDLQGGETELCARLREEYGEGVMYNPDAVVAHKVFPFRTRAPWMVERAFWQGYSKRMMQTETPGSISRESTFLRQLLVRFIPERAYGLVRNPSVTGTKQFLTLLVLLGAVGVGYVYAIVDV
ncbi:MAG: glucosyl-dolichyl phosphate glucuronosyltransferase [Halobacteriales archaeon]